MERLTTFTRRTNFFSISCIGLSTVRGLVGNIVNGGGGVGGRRSMIIIILLLLNFDGWGLL